MLIRETIEIDASCEKVMAVLCDLSSYESWNPWIVRAKGDVKVGNIIDVWGKVGGKVSHFQHKILAVDPGVFHWCDLGFFTHFAYGERKRTFSEQNGQTLFTVELNVTGVFAFMASWFFGKSLQEGMAGETLALKQRAESLL